MIVSQRLTRKIEKNFPAESDAVLSILQEGARIALGGWSIGNDDEGRERVLGGVVMLAGGDVDRLIEALELMTADWRDLLMASGLADDDWPSILDEFLDSKEL